MEDLFDDVKEVADLKRKVEIAQAMQSLKEDERFKLIFDDGFVRDWALTQTYNISAYQLQTRAGVMEQMVARSIFSQYCDGLIEDGKIAKDTLRNIEEETSPKE